MIGPLSLASTMKNIRSKTHLLSLFLTFCFTLCPISGIAGEPVDSEILKKGAALFQETCAACHGEKGEGVEDLYDQELAGDASIAELTRVITETMPEEDPTSCVGDDAENVARYIYETFYGPKAQLAKNPPRKRLARLTATQLRRNLADLYIRFADSNYYSDERGLKARYYNRDKKKDGEVQFDRVDPIIDFDFGHDGPGQGVNPKNFSINWTGALRPSQSGRYEIIVNSESSFVLNFGEYERELINNYVQSAERTEFRETVQLEANYLYPISIALSQRNRKTEQPPANITLSWKNPRGVKQVIPQRALINVYAQPTFSLQTKLPPDDRSYGYERGIAVDRQWIEATTLAAVEFADQVAFEAWPKYLKRHENDSNDDRQRVRKFLTGMVETAFRGPLDDFVQEQYVEAQIDSTESDVEAIKRSLLLALKSPRFLYPELDQSHSPSHKAAKRLALILHDSLPVADQIRNAAREDRLKSDGQIRDMAWGMVNDWRTRAKTEHFLHSWLNWSHLSELSKPEDEYPGFNTELVDELHASIDAFINDVVWSEPSDFRRLFLADWSYTSPRIAEIYGDGWKLADPEQSFGKTSHTDTPRHGVLTHPLLMSGLAYHDASSPIHRGVFLLRYVLGRKLRPPNEAFTPFSPTLHPNLNTRERTTLQTSEKSCQVCHKKINGLGFTLEHFDAIGRYRTTELGRTIDATGRYTNREGADLEFDGPKQLAEFLANDEDSHRAFVNRAFQFFVKQPPAAYDLELEDRLVESFKNSNYNIRNLLVEITVAASLDPEDEDEDEK